MIKLAVTFDRCRWCTGRRGDSACYRKHFAVIKHVNFLSKIIQNTGHKRKMEEKMITKRKLFTEIRFEKFLD
jgi:hypothetical protein